MNQHELWASMESDLMRARQTLPGDATNHEAISRYHEYLEHNELELACDVLEHYAEEHSVSDNFWLALRDAAVKMDLPNSVSRFGRRISNRGATPNR